MRKSSALNGLKVAAAAALALAAVACASQPAKDTFGLTAAPAVTGPARKGKQVLIANPVALQMLDSDGIVVRVSAQEYQYLGNAQWSDRLPKMVQVRLAQAFQNSGKVGGAGLPGEGLAIDEQIQTTINAFEVSAAQGSATVEIAARLLNDRTGQVRAARTFHIAIPVSGTGSKAYVAALNAAFGQVEGELVSWALGAM